MSAKSAVVILHCVAALMILGPESFAQVPYFIDDGFAEISQVVDPGEDVIWMNTFPVQPGGEMIDQIQVAFGRPQGPSSLNGLPATVLLYQDLTGGWPVDATLLQRVDIVITNANTAILNTINITPTSVTGTLMVGVLFRNTTSFIKGVAPIDLTLPLFEERSYFGYAASIDPANLGAFPVGVFGVLEDHGILGNYVIRAHGVAIPGAGPFLLVGAGCIARSVRRNRDG